jgi:hypothetical protein
VPFVTVQIFTSSFKLAGRHPRAVAIACGVPVWFRGRRYDALRPPRSMLRIRDAAQFATVYAQLLAKLDAAEIAQELGDGAILLCWEAPGAPGHRLLVAQWLHATAGVTTSEWCPAASI